jgi:hypothetical protein
MALPGQETYNAAFGGGAWQAPAQGGMSFMKALQDAQAMKFQREQAAADSDWRRMMETERMDLTRQQLENSKRERQADRNAKEKALEQGKRPGETTVRMLSEAQLMPGILGGLGGLIKDQPKLFGPAMGRTGAVNPYDEPAQKVNAQIEAAAQMVGKYMEGGVLRAEDVIKYKRMLPQLSDTPDVAAAKLSTVQDMLAKKYNKDLESFTQGGYDVSKFNPLQFGGGAPQAETPQGGGGARIVARRPSQSPRP